MPFPSLRWHLTLYLVLVFTAAPLSGCGSPEEPSPPLEEHDGSISGQVSDPFGAALAGVTVMVSGTTQVTSITDMQGQFQFLALPAGSYSLTFSLDGFDRLTQATQVKPQQNTRIQAQLAPESLPSAGSRGVRFVSNTGTRLEFEVDVVVIGANGAPLDGLGNSSFSILDFDVLHFERQSVSSAIGTNEGPYSALLLMDQSGSILGTDPVDSRIQAGKIFFSALSAPDNAMLAAFASSGSLPYTPITLWGSFTSSGSGFYGPLDKLAHMEGGGTPLYASTAALVDHVSSNGPNPNRAVVVFTDGEDTDGTWSMDQVISLAQSKRVKLFTVGLSSNINFQVLSQMAAETGGAMMWAGDARQLISMYGSLGNLLRGTARFYRTRWSVIRSSDTWGPGGWISSSVKIQTPAGALEAPFYVRIPGAGVLPQYSSTRSETSNQGAWPAEFAGLSE
jgi:Carboxypeptidase regulatory-like domain/von Willebrand factor type A domain